MMRIITGIAKGRKLFAPKGTDIMRPTSEIVKEGFFSSIQFDIEGSIVFDMFAGSGALGIEALSRGAVKAYFTDNNPICIRYINKNLDSLSQYNFSYEIINSPCSVFLKKNTNLIFDIAFLDPPYEHSHIQKTLPLIVPKMSERGIIVCEHEKELSLSEIEGFSLKVYRHGEKSVSIYRASH